MGILPKKRKNYEEEAVKAILKKYEIFSYQAAEGKLDVNFSALECTHHWEVEAPIADLLNNLLDRSDAFKDGKGALVSASEIGKDFIWSMDARAVDNGKRKRKRFSIVEEERGPAIKSEDGGVKYTSENLILVETSSEKIKWVLDSYFNPLSLRMIIYLFGNLQDYQKIVNIVGKREIAIQLVLPLEMLVAEHLKSLVV